MSDHENEAPADGQSAGAGLGSPAIATCDSGSIGNGTREVKPDGDKALEFLRRHGDGGEAQLHAIDPDGGGIETRTFPTEDGRREFIERWSGRRNIYFTVNPLKESAPREKKPGKADIAALAWCHVDVDPREGETPEAAEIRINALLGEFKFQPTEVIYSGGGVQAFWKLKQPIPIASDPMVKPNAEGKLEPTNREWYAEIERTEAGNKALAARFGGDHCHDICRIMRAPGTINLPNAKKRKLGRRPRAATLRHIADFAYDLADVQAAAESGAPPQKNGDGLAPELKARLDDLLARDEIVRRRWEGDKTGLKDITRSGMDMSMTGLLKARGFDRDEIRAILRTWEHGKAKEQGGRYTDRAFENATAPDPDKWACDDDGKIIANSQHNIRLALTKAGASLRFNEFADAALIETDGRERQLEEHEIVRMWLVTDQRFGFRPGYDLFYKVVVDLARRSTFHPVKDYFKECRAAWDGQPRLDTRAIRHGGVEDTPYARAASSLPLIAAVHRVMKPGEKYDEMLVLESTKQGLMKSTAIATLAVKVEWFTDSMPLDAEGRETLEQTSGKLIAEAAELNGMQKGSVEKLKVFLSRCFDRGRPAFGRLPIERGRQFVVIGTTNGTKYLMDKSGGRRFWPLRVRKPFDIAALKNEVAQLWGEAIARYEAGESCRMDKSIWEEAAKEQMARTADDAWDGVVESVFGDAEEGYNGKIKRADAFLIVGKGNPKDQGRDDVKRLDDAMASIGFETGRRKFGGPSGERCYERGTDDERQLQIEIEEARDDHGHGTGRWQVKPPSQY